MPGDRERFCDSCEKHVYDLSAGTEEEARTLIAKGTRMCVRFVHANGFVKFGVAASIALTSCSSAMPMAPEPTTPVMIETLGDYVPDEVDKCPDNPGPNDPSGCPEKDPDAGHDTTND
jgi:hypothetical protein